MTPIDGADDDEEEADDDVDEDDDEDDDRDDDNDVDDVDDIDDRNDVEDIGLLFSSVANCINANAPIHLRFFTDSFSGVSILEFFEILQKLLSLSAGVNNALQFCILDEIDELFLGDSGDEAVQSCDMFEYTLHCSSVTCELFRMLVSPE